MNTEAPPKAGEKLKRVGQGLAFQLNGKRRCDPARFREGAGLRCGSAPLQWGIEDETGIPTEDGWATGRRLRE